MIKKTVVDEPQNSQQVGLDKIAKELLISENAYKELT